MYGWWKKNRCNGRIMVCECVNCEKDKMEFWDNGGMVEFRTLDCMRQSPLFDDGCNNDRVVRSGHVHHGTCENNVNENVSVDPRGRINEIVNERVNENVNVGPRGRLNERVSDRVTYGGRTFRHRRYNGDYKVKRCWNCGSAAYLKRWCPHPQRKRKKRRMRESDGKKCRYGGTHARGRFGSRKQ